MVLCNSHLYGNTGWAKKTGPFLRVDNFATVTVSDIKACYRLSKVCKFCL